MSTPARPRFTPQLLNLRHIERTLAEQKEFGKAQKARRAHMFLTDMRVGLVLLLYRTPAGTSVLT